MSAETTPPVLPESAPGGVRRFVLGLILALAGIGVTVVVLQDHLTVAMGNHAEGMFCSGAGHFDCNPVAAHPASWMLGMPTAFWGLVFYIVMAGIALLALRASGGERAAAVRAGALLSSLALAVDAWLAFVMLTQIGVICLTCVTTWAINVALAAIFWTGFAREAAMPDLGALLRGWRPRAVPGAPEIIGVPWKLMVGAVFVAGIACATWLTIQSVLEVRSIARQEVNEFLDSMKELPTVDMASFEGLPARGPAAAPLTIVVAADFQCTWCRGLSSNLADLERRYPGKIREVYLHSPLTKECGPPQRNDIDNDPCWLAETGVAAARQGKFWEYHDYLFQQIPLGQVGPSGVMRRFAAIGLDSTRVFADQRSGVARAEVEREVALRDTLHLDSTPSFVIRGHVKAGGISPFSLRAIVSGILSETR